MAKSLALVLLTAVLAAACAKFNRASHFGNWYDADKDGQDTRTEVLVIESLIDVTFVDSREKKVKSGRWHCPYKNADYGLPQDLDIDHMVPLKEAYESGAWRWSKARRQGYANYLVRENHLIAVDKSENRSKSDQDPGQWLPPNTRYHKQYVREWCDIKARWSLTADSAEVAAIRSVLGAKEAKKWLKRVRFQEETACGE